MAVFVFISQIDNAKHVVDDLKSGTHLLDYCLADWNLRKRRSPNNNSGDSGFEGYELFLHRPAIFCGLHRLMPDFFLLSVWYTLGTRLWKTP